MFRPTHLTKSPNGLLTQAIAVFPSLFIKALAVSARNAGKPHLPEVTVKGEGGFCAAFPHDLEACAIDEGEPSPFRREEGAHPGRVHGLVDPEEIEHRHDILLQQAHRLHADAVLEKGNGFQQDIVARDYGLIGVEELLPCPFRLFVVGIIGIENGQKRGGVDKDTHFP